MARITERERETREEEKSEEEKSEEEMSQSSWNSIPGSVSQEITELFDQTFSPSLEGDDLC